MLSQWLEHVQVNGLENRRTKLEDFNSCDTYQKAVKVQR